jgi:hypothetical protein
LRNNQKSGDVTKNAVSGDNLARKPFRFCSRLPKSERNTNLHRGRGPLLGRYGPALYLGILNRDGPDRNGMRVSIPIRHENAVIFGRLMEFPLGSAGSRRRGRKLPFRPVN